jgi:hypothetical protein
MFWEFRKAVRVAEVSLSKMRCEIGKDLDEKNSKTFLKAET